MSTRCAGRIQGSPAARWETQRTCYGTSKLKVERKVDEKRASRPAQTRRGKYWLIRLSREIMQVVFILMSRTPKFLFS